MMILVGEKKPILGEMVIYQGIKGYITFNPFDRSEDSLGFLYSHPFNGSICWRLLWPTDEYSYQPERLNPETSKEDAIV